MNWTKTSRGDWAAYDGRNRYVISRMIAYEPPPPGRTMTKQIYVWRMRINGTQVGGADKCAVWYRVSDAKAYADDLAIKENPDPFEIAMKALPACIAGGLDQPKTVSDLVYQALHELDMYNEGQDGAITARQAAAVRKFVHKFRTTEAM